MKQKRYKSVEILETKGINRIVCAPRQAGTQYWLLPSADHYLARKHVFIFITVRVKKHNLNPLSPSTPPPRKKIQKKKKRKGCERFQKSSSSSRIKTGQISHTHRHPVRCYTRWFAILLQHCFSTPTLSCAKNRNLGQNFLEFFNASGENRASLSIQFLYPLPVFIQRMVMT